MAVVHVLALLWACEWHHWTFKRIHPCMGAELFEDCYEAQRASSGGPTLLNSASENLAVDDVPREDLPSVPLRLPWAPSTSTATTRTPLPADGGYPERERAT